MRRLLLVLAACVGACFSQAANDNIVVVGNQAQPVQWEHRSTIQQALQKAGPTGTIWIPASYAGTDCNPVSSCSPGTTLVIDLRNGAFQISGLFCLQADSGVTRTAAAVLNVGTCAAGDQSGTLNAAILNASPDAAHGFQIGGIPANQFQQQLNNKTFVGPNGNNNINEICGLDGTGFPAVVGNATVFQSIGAPCIIRANAIQASGQIKIDYYWICNPCTAGTRTYQLKMGACSFTTGTETSTGTLVSEAHAVIWIRNKNINQQAMLLTGIIHGTSIAAGSRTSSCTETLGDGLAHTVDLQFTTSDGNTTSMTSVLTLGQIVQ